MKGEQWYRKVDDRKMLRIQRGGFRKKFGQALAIAPSPYF